MKIPRQLRAALIAALALAAFAPRAAPAADSPAESLSEADRQCLGCHGEAGLTKTFGSGESLSLQVQGPAFAKSVHAPLGCAACHGDVDLKKHPGDVKTAASARAFSIAMMQACRTCHEASFEAHAAGVHGRAKGGVASAGPLCVDCHGSHDVARTLAGPALREACLACHADSPAAHERWLPNTKTHLNVVSCAACHAPAAGKRVELRFYDLTAKRELVSDGRPFTPAAGGNGGSAPPPLDASALRELVRAVDRGGGDGNVVLVGRVEPVEPAQGHRLLPKSQALKDCAACHRKGADAFQKVSLSVVGPDGQRTRYEAQSDVLHAPTSVESVGAFYAMGGTRIQLLDVVLALALVGGISAPVGHLLMRKFLRKKDERHE